MLYFRVGPVAVVASYRQVFRQLARSHRMV